MRRIMMLSLLCAGLSLARPAWASRDGGWHSLGDPYYLYAAKTYGDHAADHVHILRQFMQAGAPPAIGWVRQHLEAVRDNATSCRWAYEHLSSAIKNNPSGKQELGEIETQYAQVLRICDQIDLACVDSSADPAVVYRLFDQLQSTLSGARAGHQDLAFEFGDDH